MLRAPASPADLPARALNARRSDGFTLIELLVSVAILGVIMSAVTGALLVALKTAPQADNNLNNSRDQLVMSAYFAGDVQGATTMATTGTPKCQATGQSADTLVLELVGTDFTAALANQTVVVDYTVRTVAGATTFHRLSCITTAATPTYPLTATSDLTLGLYLSATSVPSVACVTSAGTGVACTAATVAKATMTVTNLQTAKNEQSVANFTAIGARMTT